MAEQVKVDGRSVTRALSATLGSFKRMIPRPWGARNLLLSPHESISGGVAAGQYNFITDTDLASAPDAANLNPLSVTAGFLPWEDFYWSCIEASILESNAEKVAIPPNQSAFANCSEIVKGQCELKRYELAILTPYASSDICDVADSAMMHTRFLAEKNQRAFVDFRPADRSAFERAFPSIEAI